MRTAGAALALLWSLAAFASAPAPARPEATDGAPGCRYARPAGWQQARTLRWTGPCSGGLAEGSGVLVGLGGAPSDRFFYGRMAAGQIVFGVVEVESGYLAGHFDAGRLRAQDERAAIVRAFDEASLLARQHGEQHQRAGNAASARFYLEKARQLGAQMD